LTLQRLCSAFQEERDDGRSSRTRIFTRQTSIGEWVKTGLEDRRLADGEILPFSDEAHHA